MKSLPDRRAAVGFAALAGLRAPRAIDHLIEELRGPRARAELAPFEADPAIAARIREAAARRR